MVLTLWTDQRDRAVRLAKTAGAVQLEGRNRARVVSFSTPGKTHTVASADGAWVCDCDFYVATGLQCGHTVAARYYLTIERGATTEHIALTPATAQAAYDAAQTQEVALFDALLADLCAGIEEPEQHMGRPRLALRDQVFVAVQKVYSQLSSRRARSLFVNAAQRGQVEQAPSFIAPSRFLNRADATPILRDLIHQSARPLAALESDFAIDSTGFTSTSFGAYLGEKHHVKREHAWVKAHLCVGVKTHVVTDIIVTDSIGPGSGDPNHLPALVQATAEGGFTIKEVSADKAYSSRLNHDAVRAVGAMALIPFKANAVSRSGNKSSPKAWRDAFHYFQLHQDEFYARYHKRSNVESVNSAIKRKLGETLKSKNRVAQQNELLCKVLAYNIVVLIHQAFEAGINLGCLKPKSGQEAV